MKNGINKTISKIIYDYIDYLNMPDSYKLFVNKHTPHAEQLLQNKLEKLKKFAEKNHGELSILDNTYYIMGDNKTIRFQIIADVIVMKEFDKIIDNRNHE